MTRVAISDLRKTPFQFFGGKTDAAEHVWAALGDVGHYIEPFFGSGAVLLRRPHPCNRPHYSESVNDIDGLLCNFWRAVRADPDAVAEHASWPVCEADQSARHLALLAWRTDAMLERLAADVDFCDPRIAGWWVWGLCSWIGSGWCSGMGAWVADEHGRLARRPKSGGVSRQRPSLSAGGIGVNHPGTREPGVEGPEHEYHPMTMPELRRWLGFLSARLRHVRIINGDWTRIVTAGASKTMPVRLGGVCGVFLDPPYSDVRAPNLYSTDSLTVAHDARAWCVAHGADPQYRIVLAGYDTEHTELDALGWRCVEWFRSGFGKGGYGNQGKNGHSQRRERLWLSPHCLDARSAQQISLFGDA